MRHATKLGALTLIAAFALCGVRCFGRQPLFDHEVTWTYGKEGRQWKTTINNGSGRDAYDLILRPLWAVEGGVIALEIVVAHPEKPEANLLGERKNGVEYPFVITVEELETGLTKSKFGAVRTFNVDDMMMNVRIENFRLGKGVGSGSTYCAQCRNLQDLSMRISVVNKTS